MDRIESEIRNLIRYHSELSSQKLQNQYIITGRFGFKTKIFDDEIIDAYKIEMRLDDKFRQQLPIVKEIAGRIKRNINNHINKDGTCCLGVPHQIKAKLGANFTLLEFFDQVVTGYFAQYSYKEKHGDWPFGEASHFQVGLLEYYMESFGLQTFKSVEKFLEKHKIDTEQFKYKSFLDRLEIEIILTYEILGIQGFVTKKENFH